MPTDDALIQIVDAALAEAARRSGPWLLCRPGCAQCCLGEFPITQLDAARLRGLPRESALKDLKTLPGIGDFSAELILLRGAGDPDAVAYHEPRLARAVADAYGLPEPATPAQLTEISEAWRPYRTWVTLLLRIQQEIPAPSR